MLANSTNGTGPLEEVIHRAGFSCQVAHNMVELENDAARGEAEAVLLDLESFGDSEASRAINRCHQLKPVVAVVSRTMASEYDPSLNPDELVFNPIQDGELLARVRQAIYRVQGSSGSEILKIGDITVDLGRYDVTVAGRRVALTYKEFQLLVLLASNPGRVYSRESLLSQVWGYDYLGGTRTVDVHVRRLRSKIEGPDRSYIETIYLVGYRFKAVS